MPKIQTAKKIMLGVRVDKDIKDQFFQRAFEEDLTPSEIIRELIDYWLSKTNRI